MPKHRRATGLLYITTIVRTTSTWFRPVVSVQFSITAKGPLPSLLAPGCIVWPMDGRARVAICYALPASPGRQESYDGFAATATQVPCQWAWHSYAGCSRPRTRVDLGDTPNPAKGALPPLDFPCSHLGNDLWVTDKGARSEGVGEATEGPCTASTQEDARLPYPIREGAQTLPRGESRGDAG